MYPIVANKHSLGTAFIINTFVLAMNLRPQLRGLSVMLSLNLQSLQALTHPVVKRFNLSLLHVD